MITLIGIDNFQTLEAVVSGPSGANRLIIHTGVAMFSFKGNGDTWVRDSLTFEIGQVFAPGQVLDSLATASLSSISNTGTSAKAGWAVDKITAQWDSVEQRIRVIAALAVNGTGGYVQRIGFQVTVLAKV